MVRGSKLPSLVGVRHQSDLHGPADDWSGTTDPAKRRKLQNRLHQRAWRRRQAMQRKIGVNTNKDVDAELRRNTDSSSPETPYLDRSEPPYNLKNCSGDAVQVEQSLSRFEGYAHAQYLEGSPRTDLLLTLIKFNVFRGLMANDQSLGFDKEWLECEALSPFYLPQGSAQRLAQTCPANLRPTALQLTVEHHPWIDLLPDTRIRNNILLLGGGYDDGPLCHDIVDNRHAPYSESLLVWGDPCVPENWEIGEDFYKKWAIILQGCHRLFRATNSWRAKRGERRLFSEVLCSP